jgi:predicted metalloprotease with PDZ domain
LPVVGRSEMTDGYRTYLGLCSHEYFHTWNVKRIKPAAFAPYDLTQENLTSLLWLFEGFTSYYDDLILVRSGVIGVSDYFGLLGKTVAGVLRGSGRLKQSVAQSSFDAWIKYYRQDENAPNAIVSYYTKGSLVALAFDLTIRLSTQHRKSLDDVMRLLWRRYGRDFYMGRPRGIAEADVEALFAEATGLDLGPLFRDIVHGTRDVPLEALLAPFGITLAADTGKGLPALGARLRSGADCVLAAVHEHGAAQKAGLSAGDTVVALDGLRVTGANLDTLLARYRPGDKLGVHAFRRDELRYAELVLDAPETTRYKIVAEGGTNGRGRHGSGSKQGPAQKIRRAWLGR